MIGKTIAAGGAVITVALASAALLGQQKPGPPPPTAGIEFPVLMQQNVTAGKTPVGTKVQAKLAVATLVNGVVVPEGAILSGEVTESVAKSAVVPSRLAICMESSRWKNGSVPIKVYLTAWYYPVARQNQDLSSGLPDADNRSTVRTGGAFPGPRNPTSPPFSAGSDASATRLPASSSSQHRVLMKNVESTRNNNGAVILTSKYSNLKLDKQTTYVLATDSLLVPAR